MKNIHTGRTIQPKRFKNAWEIWNGGASNPRAVARALVQAIDEATEDGGGSDAANDPAVHMVVDQLCFLVGLPQVSLAMSHSDWNLIMKCVEERIGK